MTEAEQGARAGDGKPLTAKQLEDALTRAYRMGAASVKAPDLIGHIQAEFAGFVLDQCAALASAPAVSAPVALETAEEARKDRAHAEAYYRQAEKLLTATEQTLHEEIQRLTEMLAAATTVSAPLTDEHLTEILASHAGPTITPQQIARAVERAHGIQAPVTGDAA